MPTPLSKQTPANYRRGAAYAMATAGLLALQEPFSAVAARRLSANNFLALTQVSLLMSLPLLLSRAHARRDFKAILRTPAHWPKLLVLFSVGVSGLLLYDVALSSAHPIISAAELNLSPFWAALVARMISAKRLPPPALAFIFCFLVGFAGAMTVAFSQIDTDTTTLSQQLLTSLLHSRWIWAIPMPLFFALNGTLVYEWFGEYDEGAAVSANFLVSALLLIPAGLWISRNAPPWTAEEIPAIGLLLAGTLASSAAGRVFYQAALSATHNDNAFVTMFFLAIPAASTALSWLLSPWVAGLQVVASPTFFCGLALVSAPLGIFYVIAVRRS